MSCFQPILCTSAHEIHFLFFDHKVMGCRDRTQRYPLLSKEKGQIPDRDHLAPPVGVRRWDYRGGQEIGLGSRNLRRNLR